MTETKPTAGPRLRCLKCGDVIQSMHVHDWVQCSCHSLFVDGGGEYLRIGYQKEDEFEFVQDIPENRDIPAQE